MLNRLKILQASGKLAAAEASFSRIIVEQPSHMHGWLGLGYCASLNGDLEGAMRAFETAAAVCPAAEDAVIDCALGFSHLGRPATARKMLLGSPETMLQQLALGTLEEGLGHFEEAAACYDAAQQRDITADLPIKKMIDLRRRQGAFIEAHRLIDRLAAMDARHEATAWQLKAQVHGAAGDRDAAVTALRIAAERDPLSDDIIISLVRELLNLRHYEEAHARLDRHPASYRTLVLLADMALADRNHDAAVGYAEAAQALDTTRVEPLLALARIEVDRGRYAAAEAAAERIAALGPHHRLTALRTRLGNAKATGDDLGALRLLQTMRSYQSTDATILADLARQYRLTGHRSESARTIDLALARDPYNLPALAEASDQARLREDWDAALAFDQTALAVAPERPANYFRVMRLLNDLDRSEEAGTILKAAEAKFGRTVEALAERIRILRENGQPHEALLAARQARRAYPAHFGRWFECFTLEYQLSSIDDARACLDLAPAQTRADDVNVLVARARLALRALDIDLAVTCLNEALTLQPHARAILTELFNLHFRHMNVEQAVTYHNSLARLDAPNRRMRGATPNASQSHRGQLLNDLLVDRGAVTELAAISAIAPAMRIPVLLRSVKKRPDHIPTAIALIVALQLCGMLTTPLASPRAETGSTTIPRRIGQFWDAEEPPKDLLAISASWTTINPYHVYHLFNDRTAQVYLTSHFPAAVVTAYRRCQGPTTKADLFRLAFLVKEGGVWADMDDRCLVPLSDIIPGETEACFWLEQQGTLCNNFMAAVPGHPILRRALVSATNAINRGDRDKVWMLTGPGLLTRAFAMEMSLAGDDWQAWLGRICVLNEFDIHPRIAIHCRASYKRLGKHWLKTSFESEAPHPTRLPAQSAA